jgi:hypothetical protein
MTNRPARWRLVKASGLLGLAGVLLASTLGNSQVQPSFFGMHVNKLSSMPVDVPIGSMRLWDTATNWFQLCPSSDYSKCEWQHLDDWLVAAKSNGVSEVAYTFGKTPDWASSDPTGDCWGARPGVCYPPRDLAADGGGTDQSFRHFVEVLVEHNAHLDSRTHAKIKFWGICNEPTAKFFWRGTNAQLVRMAKDASEIIRKADPGAKMLTPEPAANARRNATDAAVEWFNDYLSKGGGKYADVIAFHVYANAVGEHPVPEDVLTSIRRIKAELARHPEVAGKPLWITEGSWGQSGDTRWNRDDDAGAFLARFYLLTASEGIERLYWYGWDVPTGTLWANGHSLPATNALKQIHSWLVGRSVNNCQSKSDIWECDIIAPGFHGRIVWDDEYQKRSTYDASGFDVYRSVTGEHGSINQAARLVSIGNSPVLLEQAHPAATGRSGR